MICQGDIARYRELAADICKYGKARSWYLKAQHIAPKNGRPYNHLALLAIYTRRKLDAVYYYMKSLAASHINLFEETKRKAEQMDQKQQKDVDAAFSHQGPSTTFWHTTEDSQKCNGVDNLSPSDLNKRFLLSFLHAQGKLFTRIGMETFHVLFEKVLKEFQALLEHSPSPIGSTRMLQLMAINKFTVNNCQSKDVLSEGTLSVVQEQATSLGLSMFSLLVNRCINLLQKQKTEQYSSMAKQGVTEDDVKVKVSSLPSDLKELLPRVTVWSDWILAHPDTWNPPPSPLQGACTRCLECFGGVLQLTDLDCKRVTVLKYFLEALCGQEEPLLAFKGGKYVSVAPVLDAIGKETGSPEGNQLEDQDDVVVEECTEDLDLDSSRAEHDFRELRAKKHALARKLEEQKCQQQKIQAVLDGKTRLLELI
ncbi:hypothetical protein AB205_0207450 [Aquarana catesbeiana]|uniref:DNA/RNA-binding domain-containing protein n=1 Tax=Aquarana catesbeiana TaxID=8400 RepID=A0A2G9S4H8_AQUCT|nr:hypothetical protein AB205_0207450 [Aquarana catesbeiana]